MHALFTFCFFSPKIFVTPSFVTPFFTTLSQTSCHKIDATTTKSTALTFASSIRFYHRNQMRLTHIAFDSITEFQMRHKHIAFDPIRIQMRHRVDRDFAERGLQDGSIAGRGLQDSSIAGRGLQDVDCRMWIAGRGLQVRDCGCGLQDVDCRTWIAGQDCGRGDCGRGLRTAGLRTAGLRTWRLQTWIADGRIADGRIAGRGLQDVDCRQGLRAGTAGLISLQTFLLLQCRAIDYSQTRVPPKLHTTAFDLSTFRHP